MKVSVIIPTYKGSKNIQYALNSLVEQSFSNFEVIVVDDNGEGTAEQIDTKRIVDSYSDKLNLRYYSHPINSNGSVARNTGIKHSRGEYIAFLDDDDLYLKNRIKNAIAALEEEQDCDLVFCNVLIQRYSKFVEVIKPYYSRDIQKELIINTSLFGTGSNLFLKREFVLKINGFNESYFRRQDNEFLLRALADGKYKIIDTIDIVKCNDGSSNSPVYDRLVESNKQYDEDFKRCFSKLTSHELSTYKEREAARLLFCSMMNNDKKGISESINKLNEYRKINKKEIIQLVLSKVAIGESNLLNYIQPLMSKLKNNSSLNSIIKSIDKDIIKEIMELRGRNYE